MAIAPDKVFLRAFKWFKDATQRLQTQLQPEVPPNIASTLTDVIRTRLGLQLNQNSNNLDLSTFEANNAEAQSLAVAAMVTGEALARCARWAKCWPRLRTIRSGSTIWPK